MHSGVAVFLHVPGWVVAISSTAFNYDTAFAISAAFEAFDY